MGKRGLIIRKQSGPMRHIYYTVPEGGQSMRLPNGYGGISKLPGNRRKPWRVRVTDRWELTEDNKGKQIYKTIGYYSTRKEAMLALSAWHEGKETADIVAPTLQQVYDAWYESYTEDLSTSAQRGYASGYKPLLPLANKQISSITLSDYEMTLQQSGKTDATLQVTKVVLQLMYKYSYAHGFVTVDQVNMLSYLDIKRIAPKNRTDRPHKIFTTDEIRALWLRKDDMTVSIILVLIYTGLRVNELLENPKENWHDTYIDIVSSKTAAGVRQVPIADKIAPLYLDLRNKKLPSYQTMSIRMRELPLPDRHTCHDTRHTTATLLASALVDERIIKMILGHSGNSITFNVYTHNNLDIMREAINKI